MVYMIMVFVDELGNGYKFISLILKSGQNCIQRICDVFGAIMAQDDTPVAELFILRDPFNDVLGPIILPVKGIHIPLYRIVMIFLNLRRGHGKETCHILSILLLYCELP